MKFLPPQDEVKLYESVFDDDFLERQKISKNLSEIVDRIEDPLVIAIDGKWGTGKTYFLKRWVAAHRIQNNGRATTVYFDAFESDYLSDPLTALIPLIAERLPSEKPGLVSRFRNLAFGLVKPAARIGLSVVTAGASTVLSEIGDAGAEALSKEAQQFVDQYWAKEEGRRKAMKDFNEALAFLTQTDTGDTCPLVIVVDELDRCRPDYALEVLEVIKHFFTAPNVHFVLGVNFKALEDIVRVRYGASVDTGAYLRKFVHFSISLPSELSDHERTPTTVAYLRNMAQRMGIPSHFSQEVVEQVKTIGRNHSISIRDAGRILSSITILPAEALDPNTYKSWRRLTVTLLITRVLDPPLFERMVGLRASLDEIKIYFGADDRFIKRKLNSESQNPDYSGETLYLYSLWYYVISNGSVREDLELPPFDRVFDRFGDRDVKRIPATIFEIWLNVINLT